MAPSTDSRFTRLLMFDAVPNSSANILATLEIWSLGGMISEIMLVPLLTERNKHQCYSFTIMNMAYAFLLSDLHCSQGGTHSISTCIPWNSNPWTWQLLAPLSTGWDIGIHIQLDKTIKPTNYGQLNKLQKRKMSKIMWAVTCYLRSSLLRQDPNSKGTLHSHQYLICIITETLLCSTHRNIAFWSIQLWIKYFITEKRDFHC